MPEETPVQNQETPAPNSTPEQNQPPASGQPPIDQGMVLAQQLIQEAHAQRRAAEERARLAEEALKATPRPTEDPKAFFENPKEEIQKMLDRSMQPVNEFRVQFQKQAEYDKIKGWMRNNTAQYPYFSQVEAYMDQQFPQLQIINVEAINFLYFSLVGALSNSGQLRPNTPTPAPAPVPTPQIVPPSVRPSNPPAPSQLNGFDFDREIRAIAGPEANIEQYRSLARANRMPLEEFVGWLKTPASQVTTSELGKK